MTGSAWIAADPLARIEGETLNAWAALNDYARMGAGRSLRKLHEHYTRVRSGGKASVPSSRLATLEGWSAAHDWQARVEAFDSGEQDRQTDAYRAWMDAELERRMAMVEASHEVFERLVENIRMHKVTPRDAAAFMRALVEASRQVRGDTRRIEVSGPNGGPIVRRDDGLSERAAEALALYVAAAEAAEVEEKTA